MSNLHPKCPSCHASLAISADAEPDALVVCDSCGQETALHELVAQNLSDDVATTGQEDPEFGTDDLDLDLVDESDLELDFDELDADDFVANLDDPLPSSPAAKAPRADDAADADDWLTDDVAGDETDLEHEDTLIEEGLASAFELDGKFPEDDAPLDTAADKQLADVDADSPRTFHFEANVDEPLADMDVIESLDEAADEAEAAIDAAASAMADAAASAPPRRRGLIGTVLRLLAVCFAGLLLLQVIFWWAIGIDPVGLAAVMPAPLDRLAPAKLRPSTARGPIRYIPPPESFYDDEEDEAVDESDGTDALTEPAAGLAGDGSPNNSLAAAENDDVAADLPEEVAPAEEREPTTGVEPPSMAEAPPQTDGAADDLSDDLSLEPDRLAASDADAGDLLGAAEPPAVEESSEFAGYGPRGCPTYSRDDLAATFATARQTHQAFDEAYLTDSPETRRAAAAFYIAWCEMAERATLVDREGAESILAESRAMMTEIVKEPNKQLLLARWAVGWLSPRQRAKMPDRTAGVVLAGEVQSLRAAGDYFEYELALLDDNHTPIVVVTRLHPERNGLTDLSEGARLMVLGIEVDRPRDVLPTYDGNSPSVIYATDEIVALP